MGILVRQIVMKKCIRTITMIMWAGTGKWIHLRVHTPSWGNISNGSSHRRISPLNHPTYLYTT